MGQYVNGPSDGREIIHIPLKAMEVCVRSPANAEISHHYVRMNDNFYWNGKCTHEPLIEGPECEPLA